MAEGSACWQELKSTLCRLSRGEQEEAQDTASGRTCRAPVPRPPEPLNEPMVYLSAEQAAVIAAYPGLSHIRLPAWVPHALVADQLGHGCEAIRRAVDFLGGKPYLWATEFENVHSLWRYSEPRITVAGETYANSEDYYHSRKPTVKCRSAFDEKWEPIRYGVMKEAVRAKLQAAPDELRELLDATDTHMLLSIKCDEVWGFHPEKGGENLLAKVWMDIREERRASPL
uniref:NADAR domain-containing protein n=1 Tax=Hemiselmis andersenii TaxID=464988 RepID=A0A6U5CBU5_HEMAN|mmetsp:Transcript_382/g.854  ORF Transcript_382/g.854 Transcript_382/m.854 type:complete len:228 (+) Transcript_382:313-996(+)|eukprot:CAMPEP_0114149726 /NCGR_PEP_ID=MMETSP0043_2-20121206/22314_1 /TAXON_ID=464988 /ORGANISM="Hemiselmis andersenii, Strain CCMP644" /LENGTH=227 /DNA_ID=CAMNT_0001244391 /DNA_START=247 /DNA_END=930 /DNA_ORIENTATION=-